MQAAGVVADHPAQGVVVVRRGIGAEGQVMTLGLAAQRVENAARLDASPVRLRVDIEHAVQILRHVQDNGNVAALAGQARAAASRQERGLVAPTEGGCLDEVVDSPGNEDDTEWKSTRQNTNQQ